MVDENRERFSRSVEDRAPAGGSPPDNPLELPPGLLTPLPRRTAATLEWLGVVLLLLVVSWTLLVGFILGAVLTLEWLT